MKPTAPGRGVFMLSAVLVIVALLAAPAFAGNTLTASGEILSVPPPVAAFSGSPLSGAAPLAVAFDASASDGVITSYAWDFNNDGTTDLTTATATASYTYAAAGTYSVKLTVIGPGGADDEAKANYITVTAPQKPVAAFTGTPTSGVAPLTVQFTDQSTNNPTSWKWEYKKGSGSWTQFSTAQSPSYTFTATGTYSIRLTATNAAGSNTLTKTNYLTVSAPPKPVAAFTATPTSGLPPLTVQFTDQSTNNPTSWKWEYQKVGTSTWTQFSTAKNPSFTFITVGQYSIRLTATNAAGSGTVTKSGYITVGRCGILIPIFTGSPTSGKAPLTVQFTDGSSGPVDSWEWDFQNDGTFDSTLKNPSFTYTAKKKYSVKMKISNACATGIMLRGSYINVQ